MEPGAVRELLLGQHTEIKQIIRELEAAALSVASGHRSALDLLEAKLRLLVEKLQEHTAAEDLHLASFPFDSETWGPEPLERLRELHAAAHDSMHRAAGEASDARRPPTSRAAGALTLVTALRGHMRVEEKYLFGETVGHAEAILDELGGR